MTVYYTDIIESELVITLDFVNTVYNFAPTEEKTVFKLLIELIIINVIFHYDLIYLI